MKEKVLLIFFLCNVALFVSAQSHMEKGLQSISRSSTEAIINFGANFANYTGKAGVGKSPNQPFLFY